MQEKKKIEFTGVAFIFAFITAFLGDFAFLFIIGILIPIIGLVIAAFVLMAHYLAGIIVLGFIWPRSHGWLAKTVLLLSVLLPLPFLMIGIILAVILSNKAIAMLAEQALIIATAPATGGASLVAEAGVLAREGEMVVVQTERAVVAAEKTTNVERGIDAANRAEDALSTPEGPTTAEVEPESLGEGFRKEPMERLQEDLLEKPMQEEKRIELPEEGQQQPPKETESKAKKVGRQMKKIKELKDVTTEDDEDEEEYEKAA